MLLGLIFWLVFSSICILQYFDYVKDLDNTNKILVISVFMIFGPAIIMSNLAEELLDLFLPEGWDDDDYIGKY